MPEEIRELESLALAVDYARLLYEIAGELHRSAQKF